jgi:hypothetical protein
VGGCGGTSSVNQFSDREGSALTPVSRGPRPTARSPGLELVVADVRSRGTNVRLPIQVPGPTRRGVYFWERPITRPIEISPLSILKWKPQSGFVHTHAL